MDTKLNKLKAAWRAGDRIGALRAAAKFPQLGEHKERISRAWAAHCHPDTYAAMGYDTAGLVADGFRALAERYNLED